MLLFTRNYLWCHIGPHLSTKEPRSSHKCQGTSESITYPKAGARVTERKVTSSYGIVRQTIDNLPA